MLLKPFETLRGALLFVFIGTIVINLGFWALSRYLYPKPSGPVIIQNK